MTTTPETMRGARRASFSSSEAAFEGLRLLRARPAVMAAWAALMLMLSFASTLLTVNLVGPQMTRLTALQALGRAAPAGEVFGVMGSLVPFYLVAAVCSLAFYAVMAAAVYRAVLRPQAGGLGLLRLGRDELVQAGAIVLMGLVLLAAELVIGLVAAIVAVIATVALTAAGLSKLAPGAVVLVLLSAIPAIVFVGVRLSLLGPLAFDTGRADVRRAWRLTRGRFWALLGAYVLAGLLLAVIGLAFLVVFMAAVLLAGGGVSAAAAVLRPDMTSLQAFLRPVQIAYLVLAAPLSALGYAVLMGAPARAYAELTAPETAPPPPERGF